MEIGNTFSLHFRYQIVCKHRVDMIYFEAVHPQKRVKEGSCISVEVPPLNANMWQCSEQKEEFNGSGCICGCIGHGHVHTCITRTLIHLLANHMECIAFAFADG